MDTYQTITQSEEYATGIYDGCIARLERHRDGRRYRMIVPGVLWHGNSGGYHEYVTYMDRAQARLILRGIRLARLRNARGDYSGPFEHDYWHGYIGKV